MANELRDALLVLAQRVIDGTERLDERTRFLLDEQQAQMWRDNDGSMRVGHVAKYSDSLDDFDEHLAKIYVRAHEHASRLDAVMDAVRDSIGVVRGTIAGNRGAKLPSNAADESEAQDDLAKRRNRRWRS